MTFLGDSGVTPDLANPPEGWSIVRFLIPSNTIPGSLKPASRDPETEAGSLETEKRVHRIHDRLETGLQIIPRSLVAPTRGARGYLPYRCPQNDQTML